MGSLCRLLISVNHAIVAIFNIANMSFNSFSENKILIKISEFTVCATLIQGVSDLEIVGTALKQRNMLLWIRAAIIH